jgi:hypothetical protein
MQAHADSVCAPLVTFTTFTPDNEYITLYPNPANDRIYLDYPDVLEGELLYVYNMLGEEVMRTTVMQDLSINNLSNGVYTLTVINKKGQVLTKQFVVQRE